MPPTPFLGFSARGLFSMLSNGGLTMADFMISLY